MLSVDQIDSLVSLVSLAGGLAGMFFGLRQQVKVLEKQVERLEVLVYELRQDIKQLLMGKNSDTK